MSTDDPRVCPGATPGVGRALWRTAVLAVAVSLPSAALADVAADDEFAVFRITDVEGAVTVRQWQERNETDAGATSAAQSERNATVTASVSARGFVYHPNLVALEAGFGLIQQRSRYSGPGSATLGDTRADETLYDLSARVSVMRDKPYTGTAYYEHLNPSVSVGPALVMLQETTRQGLQFALLDPFTPVPVSFEAERLHSSGRGSERVVDDRSDRYSLTADAALGRMGNTRLRVDHTRLDSQSGSVGLPIARTASSTLTAGLDTRLRWGAQDRYTLTQLITFNTLSYRLGLVPPPERREGRAYLDLRARHSQQWQSFATLDALNTDQGDQHGRNRGVFAGASWTPSAALVSTLEARSESFDATDYASSSRSVLAGASYQWPLAAGRAQAAYAVRYDDRSQNALSLTTPVIGERHVLAGTAAVALDRARVVAASVQVWNEARTQVYVEGRDYRLSVLGVQTRLERIVGGDILDGQTVLVDFATQNGGSFDSTQLDQSASLFWSWANQFSLSARWFDSAPRVTAGVPLLTLNAVHGLTLRAQADLPVTGLWSAGGSIEREERRETILPLRRTAADVYVQWEEALFGQGGIRIGAHRQRLAYDDARQDVDRTGYDIRYRVYTAQGVDLQADWSSETEVGDSVRRRRDFGSLRAQWRYRQLLMSLSLTRVVEAQDRLRTTRTVGQWLLRREF